ncbi:MAG: hypothetical protein ACP5R3_06975, partial [Thermoplasmata archaeon]
SKSTLDINNFLLLKILMGDKSDNIPGITGINTSVKMINIILSENNYKEILNLDDFLNMVNDYVDKKPNHLKVFDKLLENKEHFKLSSKIMDLSENNVLEMLSTTNVLDITSIIDNYSKQQDNKNENLKKLSELFEEHNFDYDLLLAIKKYILNIELPKSNINFKFNTF